MSSRFPEIALALALAAVPATARELAVCADPDNLPFSHADGSGFENRIVAICGDILHSRVARSNLRLLAMLGARVRLVGPRTLLPAEADRFGVEVHTDMHQGLKDADIVMMLRLQLERMGGAFIPSPREYFRFYGLDREKLAWAKPGALVMHPGPMNRGVEIDSEVADGPHSVILPQVTNGVAVRMAVLYLLAGESPDWSRGGEGGEAGEGGRNA